MPDVDAELFEMLSKTYRERMQERKQERELKNPVGSEKQRKLDRLKRVREKENITGSSNEVRFRKSNLVGLV